MMFGHGCRGSKCAIGVLLVIAVFFISTGWPVAVVFALLYTFGIKLPVTQITALSIGAVFTVVILLGGCCVSYVVVLTVMVLYYFHKRKFPNEKRGGNPYMAENWNTSSTKPLIHLSTEFERLVNLDALMPQLCKEGLLHSSDMDEWLRVKPSNSRTFQILHILTILDKKGQSGVCGLIRALKEEKDHTGHIDLVEILVKEYSDIAETADKRSPHYYNRSYSSFT